MKNVNNNKKSFKTIAMESMTLSDLQNGREPLKTSDITGQALTILDFDMIYASEAKYCCLIFNEAPDKYYNGGLILTKMVESWIDEYGGDFEEAREAYANSDDKVVISLTETKTKKGNNNLVTVEIL